MIDIVVDLINLTVIYIKMLMMNTTHHVQM